MSKRISVLLTKRVSDAAGRIKPCANGRGKVARWSFAGGRADQRVPHASAFIERLWVAAPRARADVASRHHRCCGS